MFRFDRVLISSPNNFFEQLNRDVLVFESANFSEELIGENGASGMSDIEGKAAREAVSERGQRANFNADVGLLQASGLEDIDHPAFGCDCFRDQRFKSLVGNPERASGRNVAREYA